MTRALVIGLLVLGPSVHGQISTPADSLGTVSITTSPAGADVYIDSLYVGKSPLLNLHLPSGQRYLKVFYPSMFAWNPLQVFDSMDVKKGSHLEKQVVLGTLLRVQSVPSGSVVAVGHFPVGMTPLYLQTPGTNLEELRIFKEGYDSLTVPVRDAKDGLVRVRLKAARGVSGALATGDLVQGSPSSDHWLTYASGATMIASGVASVYLKDRANREFDRYLLTKDPGGLSTTRRLDRGAAATLIVSQISFAILAYILLSE